MAKVFKRKYFTQDGVLRTSKVYYCRFQIAGRDYLRSTGTTSWAEAKQEMERMRRAVLEGATVGRKIAGERSAEIFVSRFGEDLRARSVEYLETVLEFPAG